MKTKVGILFGIITVFLGVVFDSVASIDQLHSLHREIGTNLIKIQKSNPAVQPVVFQILDQLGRFYSVSKELSRKKKDYKRLFKAERSRYESLQSEVVRLESKVERMKTEVFNVTEKLKKDSQLLNSVNEEKDRLQQEKERLAKEKDRAERVKQELLEERRSFEVEAEDGRELVSGASQSDLAGEKCAYKRPVPGSRRQAGSVSEKHVDDQLGQKCLDVEKMAQAEFVAE